MFGETFAPALARSCEAAAREEAHWEWVSSQAAALCCLPEAEVFSSACLGESEPGCLAPLLKLSPGSLYNTLNAMFSWPGKMASYPCFHERCCSDVSSPCSMQDLQEKVELAAQDRQDLQAHEVLLATRDPRAHRVLLGLQGTVTHPPALATAWEVSSEESGQLPFAEVGWHFLTAQVRWRLPMNLAIKCGGSLKTCVSSVALLCGTAA